MLLTSIIVLLRMINADSMQSIRGPSLCSEPRLRPEITDLSETELSRFVKAFKTLNNATQKPTQFDKISNIHINYALYGHGNSQFLPWHREYLNRFEQSLQKIDPLVTLPYWDWSKDYVDPANSMVMKKIIGTNGKKETDYCVLDGMFNNFTVEYPYPHCLKREFDRENSMSPFYSAASLAKIIESTNDFSLFSTTIEALPHATFHINMGTNNGDMNFFHSSNDIAFWLHHTFIDKLYYEWQTLNTNRSQFDNPTAYNGVTWDSSNARLDEDMLPFGIPVNYVLNTKNERLCYYYNNPTENNIPKAKSQLLVMNNTVIINESNQIVPKKINPNWWVKNNIDPKRIGGRFKGSRKGIPFTIMTVGSSGVGKSSFINTLCGKPVLQQKEYSKQSLAENQKGTEFLEIKQYSVDIEEEGTRINLNIVDTPGFGDNIDNTGCFEKLLNYLELQYDSILAEETRIKRNPRFQDNRVHALLYFITPTGHGLKEMDIELMKRLSPRTNVIPVIGRADSFTKKELQDFKNRVMEDIEYHRIPIYNFPYDATEDDEETVEENEELRRMLPFALISHEEESVTKDKGMIRSRRYPWGVIDVDEEENCDTARLRFMLFSSHMGDLRIITHDILYENYRTEKLSRTGEDDFDMISDDHAFSNSGSNNNTKPSTKRNSMDVHSPVRNNPRSR